MCFDLKCLLYNFLVGLNADKISTREWKALCGRSEEKVHSLVTVVYYAVRALLLAIK